MAYKRISPTPVVEGGTGAQTLTTAYAPICAGTSATSALQSASTGMSNVGYILTSTGSSSLPTFQAAAAGGVPSIAGTANQINESGSPGATTLSLSSTCIMPGTLEVTSSLTADTVIDLPQTTATTGIINMAGNAYIHSYGDVSNTFVGQQAGTLSNTQTYASAFGYRALENMTSGGGQNSAFGGTALQNLTSGAYNIGFGNSAGKGIQTGSYNVCIGGYVGSGNYTGSGLGTASSSNIIIENPGQSGDSNVIRIGQTGSGSAQQNACYVAGIYGSTAASNSQIALIGSTDQLSTIANGTSGYVLTSNGSSTPSWQAAPGGGLGVTSYSNTSSASVSMTTNTGYISTATTLPSFLLPATSAVGDTITILRYHTSLGFLITQGSGQQIFGITGNTTLGATGFLSNSDTYGTIQLICVVANTIWVVLNFQGSSLSYH